LQRVAGLGTDRSDFRRYVDCIDNEEACVNSVSVTGNLATDVEVREAAESKVSKFLLAIDRPSKDGGADFIGVSAWDRQGELCAEYLSKGRKVGVEGYLRSHSWEDNGKRRREVELVARRVEFLGVPKEESDGGEVVPFEAAVA
jgi:single-strand DNA-binding protein